MNNKLINRLLLLVSILVSTILGGSVFAQNQSFQTDTVYHQEFGCDNFLLNANHTVYYSDTLVSIPHYIADQGLVYMDVLDVYQITIGNSYDFQDTVNARVCENTLPYAYRGNFYTQSGSYWVSTPTLQGCDSLRTLVNLEVLMGQRDTTFVSMCNTEPIVVNGITFSTPGTFNFPQGVDDDGCPIVQTYVITQYPLSIDTVDVRVCQSELPYLFMGYSLSTPGNYRVHYYTEVGCDAVKYVRFRVCPVYEFYDTVDVMICQTELPYQYGNEMFNTSGTYQVAIPNRCGCDSLFVTLNLQVTLPQIDTLEEMVCVSDFPYMYDSLHVFSEPGTYFVNEGADSMCNNFTCLVLNAVQSIFDTVTICTPDSSYTFGDTVFTSSTVYTYSDTNAYGCLDYHTLWINLNTQLVYDTVEVNICQSERPFVFNGNEYWYSGIFEEVLQNQQGCDSAVVQIQVSVYPNPAVTKNITITRNDIPFVYYDSVFTKSGNYMLQIPAASETECDTFLYLYLTVQPVYHQELDTTVCANTTLNFLGEAITTAGLHEFVYHFADFDSIITLNVHHLPTYVDETVNVVIGEYDLPYHFADSAFYEAGYHERVLSTVLGCDSLVSLNLTVIPALINNDTLFSEVCSNDLPILMYDSLLTEAGVYRFVVHTAGASVDSVFYLRLNVKESPTLFMADTSYLCAGGEVTLLAQSTGSVYQWNNGESQPSITVNLPGQYVVTVSNAFDCSTSATVQVISVDLPDAVIVGDNQVCSGSNLLLQAEGGTEFLWGDGSTTSSITVAPTENTVYTVAIKNVYGCSVVKDLAVTVNPLPEVILQGNNSICAGETTTFFVSGAQDYQWSNDVEASQISVSDEGIYSVTATDENGCQSIASIMLTVHPLPMVKINGRNTFCQGGNTTLTATGANTYEWNSGEMTQSIVASYVGTYTVTGTDQYGCSATKSVAVSQSTVNASISGNFFLCQGQSTMLTVMGDAGNTYRWFDGSSSNNVNINTAGQYSVTVTNANGCQNTLSATVSEYNMTAPVISGTLTICEGQNTTLFASGGTSYLWSNGSAQAMITVNTTGTYSVTTTNSYGCTATATASVLVNPVPSINIVGETDICQGQNTVLSVMSDMASQYEWNNGEHNSSISVTSAGQYSVTATNSYGCVSTASHQVAVHPVPEPTVFGSQMVCLGSSTTLTATGGTGYQWSTGETTSNIVVTPTTNQTYVVTVTNVYGCLVSAAVTVAVAPLPNLTINGNTIICAGNSTTITAAGASTYAWSTGAQTANVSISNEGMYYVTATSAQNCIKTDSVYVKLNPNPVVQIMGDSHICSGSFSTLTATGASSYLWNTGEVSTEISIAPTSTTTYTVTGYDTNNCSTTVQRVVNVESLPEVQILGDRTICQGQTTVLTAMGGTSYLWSNGSNSQSVLFSPNVSTTYTVTASNAFGCASVASVTVTVNVLPSIIFSGNTTICQGQTATIVATGGNSYVWSTGATTNSINVSSPGVYKVNVTNSLNCMRSDSVTVTVLDNPTVNISGSSLVCEGLTTTLTASGASTYLWSTGETGSAIFVMPEQTTTYNVIGYDANGCSATVSKVVNVEALPQVFISGELSICHGESTTLTSSNAYAYAWSTGSTANSITVSDHGAYTVTVSSQNGCQSMASVTVVEKPLPIFTMTGAGFFCENTTEVLSVSGDNDYVWSTGDTTNQITISTGGVYTVTGTNDYGCSMVSSLYVAELPAPELSIVGVTDLCQGDTTILVADANAGQFLWSTGETTSSIVVVPDNSTYSVTATNANGCSSVAQHEIVTLPMYNISLTGTICELQGYTGQGFDIPVIDSAGVYTFVRHLQTVSGCDSTLNLLLTVNPKPQMDTINGLQNITQYGNMYYTVNDPQYVSSYEWLISNTHWTITEVNYNNATLNVTTNGTGILTARGINNCGYTEITLNLYCNVGIEDYPADAMVTLYPNPVHQSLFVNLENAPEISKVRLYNEAGRLVYQTNCNDAHLEIDCIRFANGHYTVQFLDKKGRRVESRKIVVNNN
jgi:hypothetical protein